MDRRNWKYVLAWVAAAVAALLLSLAGPKEVSLEPGAAGISPLLVR
jgi:hypothetical protein